MQREIIQRTLRVPAVAGPSGDGTGVARQLDSVLLGAGFTASRRLLEHVSGLAPATAMDLAVNAIGAVRELIGDHVAHNPYFLRFPEGVPDTVDFWLSCLRGAFLEGGVGTADPLIVDLLALPGYGRYQHSYPELVAAHDELLPSAKDRLTVLELGRSLEEETQALYLALAGAVTPPGEADIELLSVLAGLCVDGPQPEALPARENRAVLNAVRLALGRPLVGVDTVTDVLRIACQASGGDVSLAAPTRFRRLRRPERRALMAALDRVIGDSPAKLGDVARYARRWQRLGERIHPHEFTGYPRARDVFAVARGERTVRSLAGRAELAMRDGEPLRAAELLANAPGALLRQLDHLLRGRGPADSARVLDLARAASGAASGRVLCSLREHFANRAEPEPARVFVGRGRRAWVRPDDRPPLDPAVIEQMLRMVDDEIGRRLPVHEHLVVDPAVRTLAVPLSGKASEVGFGVLPRGSVMPVTGELLRFFTHWRQSVRRTDFDLSALLLGDGFRYLGHVSWTNYREDGAYYSGDVTDAAEGATEFIDVPLATLSARHVVPQVHIYSGEGFDEVAESMFGYMTRDLAQRGMPFEPRTVVARSAIRGPSRVALPVVFSRSGEVGAADAWSAKWLHLYGGGRAWANQVETTRVSTATQVRAIVRRSYLPVSYLVEGLWAKAGRYSEYTPGIELTGPVSYIGLHAPEGLPDGSRVITLDRLNELVPE